MAITLHNACASHSLLYIMSAADGSIEESQVDKRNLKLCNKESTQLG